MPRRPRSKRSQPGDLLEIEGWYYIKDHMVGAEFEVTWRHPEQYGEGGVFRPGGNDYDPTTKFGPEHLAQIVDSTSGVLRAPGLTVAREPQR